MSAIAHAAHHADQTQMKRNSSVGSQRGGSKKILRERTDVDARPSNHSVIRSSMTSAEAVKENVTKIFDNEWVIFTLDQIILVNMLQMGLPCQV